MKLHRFFIIFLSLLLITCDMRADGGDVLERIIRLPGTKGTVYSPVEQSVGTIRLSFRI